jgi:hypothetical protein
LWVAGLSWNSFQPWVLAGGMVGHTVPAWAPAAIVTGVNPALPCARELSTAHKGLFAGVKSPDVSGVPTLLFSNGACGFLRLKPPAGAAAPCTEFDGT